MNVEDLARAISKAEAKLGAIDIAVNNAGGLLSSTGDLFRPFAEVPGNPQCQNEETNTSDRNADLTLPIYEAFAANDLDGWHGVVHPDVKINSPAGRDMVGIDTLKSCGRAFHAAFRHRIDLIDHYVAGDRALLTVNLHWRHDGEPFCGLPATGKGGTSVETFMLRGRGRPGDALGRGRQHARPRQLPV
jgi:hypothetical protein